MKTRYTLQHTYLSRVKFVTGRQRSDEPSQSLSPSFSTLHAIIYGFQRGLNKQLIRSIGRLRLSDDATVSYQYRRFVGISVVLIGIELRVVWI
jgi:hypothetical protein